MTAKIELYITDHCPYCVRAKRLLEELGQSYSTINIQQQPEKRDEMLTRSNGMRTVPQIFINDQHIGGSDDLYALHQKGELTLMLK